MYCAAFPKDAVPYYCVGFWLISSARDHYCSWLYCPSLLFFRQPWANSIGGNHEDVEVSVLAASVSTRDRKNQQSCCSCPARILSPIESFTMIVMMMMMMLLSAC